MRVKVGDAWFTVRHDQPIMVELSEGDKRNIANMAPDATKYAIFDDDGPREMTREQKLAWMEDGA